MRVNHDIFNKPHKVDLTIAEQPTPASYANYPEGRTLGKTMPMWRVQTEGYLTHKGQLVGIVSRDQGFLDSPDAEWISGGVNSKGPNAVALGRHGNFFHWGFAGSPTYMTDEAKDVFVNALHYISRFAGQAPIARKKSGTMLRNGVDYAIESMSEAGYARTVARYAQIRADYSKRKAAVRKRIAAGEEVSKSERRTLQMRAPRTPGRLDRARRLVSSKTMKALGEDPVKLTAYLKENRPYYRTSGWYKLVVDEELKSVGIASDDPALLDRLVVTLLAGDRDGVAKTLLERYTAESFATAQQWATWLDANRSRLFFTEAGGYIWLVNTIGTKAKGGRAATPGAVESTAPKHRKIKATSGAPFASGLSIKPLGKGRYKLTLHVDILDGWHAYDEVPENSAYLPLRIQLDLPKGVRQVGDWNKPESHPSIEAPGLTLFEGRLAFHCELESKRAATLTCKVRHQVCDAKMCMPATEVKHRIALRR